MSAEIIKLPDVGADQVDVIEIPVRVGDTVAVEQTLIVVESDKATVDVPSPKKGRVKAVSVAIGDQISQGAPIIEIESGDDSVASVDQDVDSASAQQIPDKTSFDDDANTKNIRNTQASEASGTFMMLVPDLGLDGGAECIAIAIKVGDVLKVEDTVLTLESDKATLDIPAPVNGIVERVFISVGQTLKQGDKIAEIQIAVSSKPDSHPPAEPVRGVDEHANPYSKVVQNPAKANSLVTTHSPSTQITTADSVPVFHSTTSTSNVDQSRAYAGPSVRKLARKLGLSLVGLNGSGPKGRICKDDVLALAKQKLASLEPSANTPALHEFAGATESSVSEFGTVSILALTKIQQVSAKNLSHSWQTIPHVTQFDEADVTELEAYRKQVGPTLKEQGIRLTMLAFVIKAVGSALKSFPKVNSVLKEGWKELVLRQYCHIAFAVDTPDGLVVPVVRDVWQKSVAELARDVVDLSDRAREKKLKPRDYQGASFTISSLGGIGGTAFTPIVNPPQVAILGLSRSDMKPVWNGQSFEPRLMLPISLSYDHRVIDGADAVRFTRELARLLGDIRNLLL